MLKWLSTLKAFIYNKNDKVSTVTIVFSHMGDIYIYVCVCMYLFDYIYIVVTVVTYI